MKATVYMLGYDCGKNGPNETNSHFSLFSTRELTDEWERGKRDAESGRPPDPAPLDPELVDYCADCRNTHLLEDWPCYCECHLKQREPAIIV